MAEKYIDLYERITEHARTTNDFRHGAIAVLEWLDRHPDQVPGRTITESELIAAVDETNHEDMNEYQKARALLVHLGHTVPDPDPEPTNAEKLVNDLLDCHVAFSGRELDAIAGHLADLGWTKAPGGEDD